jgi:hypothetical protein
MNWVSAVIDRQPGSRVRALGRTAGLALGLLLIVAKVQSQHLDLDLELQALASERNLLTAELDQYNSTVRLLQTDGTPPEQSTNPVVRKLALERVRLRERLVALNQRELALLQQQIAADRNLAALEQPSPEPAQRRAETEPSKARVDIQGKPRQMNSAEPSPPGEQERVDRLHALLSNYYSRVQESARTAPTEGELAARAVAGLDAGTLDRIPFSADKVRLSGAEGSLALGRISRRLTDPNVPESRRDIAPICAVRTQLFGKLIASEQRSLRPVGKSNYVARIRLQPGSTTLRVKDDRWQVELPHNVNARDFLITLYTPPDGQAELHLFAIEELLAEEDPHIPAWLPEDVNLTPRTG